MAGRVVRSLRVPYHIDGKQLNVGVSVGYVVASSRRDDLTHLLECADRALYQIKRAGAELPLNSILKSRATLCT